MLVTPDTWRPTAVYHRPSILEWVPWLFESDSEDQVWSRAIEIVTHVFETDASSSFELVAPNRMVMRADHGWPKRLTGMVIPVAPDSQAAWVLAADGARRSDDLQLETRFVPASMLSAAGMRSSISCRFRLPEGRWGLIGAYSATPNAFDDDDERDFAGFTDIVGTAIRHQRARSGLARAASHDPLTDLLNRTAVMAELDRQVTSGSSAAALVIDLDGFKSINDEHGHRVGDEVLARVAKRIERAIAPDDRCGRLGGDEFLVVTAQTGHASLQPLAQRILSGVEETNLVQDLSVQMSASIGVAYAMDIIDATTVIDRADRQMYAAKSKGRGFVAMEPAPVSRSSAPVSRARAVITPDLDVVDEAIAGLRIVFQPIVDAASGATVGVEALTRGPSGHSLEYPDVLFTAATTFGRLGDLELEAKRLTLAADLPEELALFINFEPSILCDPKWLERMTEVLAGADARRHLVAELTERAVLAAPGRLLAAVEACRSIGLKIALDDVGARSESLAALRCVRPDVVKLDMGLIQGRNRAHAAHVSATVAGYRALNDVSVVAEGVESVTHAEFAMVLGADLLQGYHFGRPAELSQLDLGSEIARPKPRARRAPTAELWATKRDLLDVSRHIESQALTSDTMILSSIQRSQFLSERTQRQYQALARRCGFVGVVGQGLRGVSGVTMEGVRVADVHDDDPLGDAWQVVLLSPTISMALLADDLGSPSDTNDMDRRFRYRLVTDAVEVEAAANRLLAYF